MSIPKIRTRSSWGGYVGTKYTAKSYLEMVDQQQGLNLAEKFKFFVATKESHDDSIKAIAVELLTTNLPVPIGTPLVSDKIGGVKVKDKREDVTVEDFAQLTGLFTTTNCPNGNCHEILGGHEIEVVNFRA